MIDRSMRAWAALPAAALVLLLAACQTAPLA